MFIIMFSLIGCDSTTFRANFADIEDGILYESKELSDIPQSKDALRIVNYNIKYGGARLTFFWECEGTRYNMTEEEVTGNLDNIVAFINDVDPDILILQEVDRRTLRSAYIDQTQYILDRTALNYASYASQQRADYLPSDGFGPIDFGNATLSRWPVSESTRIALPLVDEYPGYYQYFYLKRHILRSKIDLPWNDDFYVVNTHLEAFSNDGTKKQQIDMFHEELGSLSADGSDWVAGGDLNSLPKGSEQLAGFPDDCPGLFEPDDYSGEEDWLDELFTDFNSAMDLDDYQTDNSKWFSYTGKQELGWTRTLDYMFTNGQWQDGLQNNYVMQSVEQGGYETLSLSDHAPVHVILEVQ